MSDEEKVLADRAVKDLIHRMSIEDPVMPPGTLNIGEHHPAADSAMQWIKAWMDKDLKKTFMVRETLASTALSGNRLAEICDETMRRVSVGEPVSDRYLLGLCWFLRYQMEVEK